MINAVTPEFVEAWSLGIDPLSNLVDNTLDVNCFGRLYTQPLGYVIIRIWVERAWGYNEDQVALIIPDPTDFCSQVQVILGTPTINQIIHMIKESEIDELSISLNGLKISHLLACHYAEPSTKSETSSDCTMDPTNLNEAIKTTKREKINAFSSKIMHTQTKTMFLGNDKYIMMQALEG